MFARVVWRRELAQTYEISNYTKFLRLFLRFVPIDGGEVNIKKKKNKNVVYFDGSDL